MARSLASGTLTKPPIAADRIARPRTPGASAAAITLGIRRWMRPGAPAAALAYLAVAMLYMAPAFVSGQQLLGTDYTAAGYMVLEYVSRVMAGGHLPTWIPQIMGGVPIFANPGATFHPVRLLLALVLPADRVLPALFVVHFALAGFGMYVLLRELDVRRWVAFLLGLAFEFTGSLASLLYAGHDGRFIVAASAPLFLAMAHRGVRTGERWPFAIAAATLGGALLSFQIQSTYYLLFVGLAWGIFALASYRLHRQPRVLLVRVGLGTAAVALGFALAAVNLLPFASYVDASPRAVSVGRDYDFATSFSMPPSETLAIAVPEQAGILDAYRGVNPLKYHTEYMGALVVALVAAGLAVSRRDRRWRFFAGLGIVALTMAWGGFTPLYRVYYAVFPGLTKFRSPGIAFYVVALALVVMAGLTLEQLAMRHDARVAARHARATTRLAESRRPALGRWARVVAMLCLLPLLVGVAERVNGPATVDAGNGWLRFGIVLVIVVALLLAWARTMLTTRHLAIGLGVVTVLDLWVVDRAFFRLGSPADTLYAADDVVLYLRDQPDVGRVWFFPTAPRRGQRYLGNGAFGLRTNYFMHFGLQQLGGEHGNQLQRWNEYLGVDSAQQVDWHNVMQSMPMLSAAGVRYAVATMDLSRYKMRDGRIVASGLKGVYRGSGGVFRNVNALTRAYLVPGMETAPLGGALAMMRRKTWDPRRTVIVEQPIAATLPGGDPDGAAAIVRETADQVTVRTTSSHTNMLVLADNYYPGWEAFIDGRPAPLYRVNHTFRGVPLPAGAHEVRFAFRPMPLYVGLWISIATASALALYGLWLLDSAVQASRRRAALGAPRAAPLAVPT